MSDESSPPLLRLKPRARLESDASVPQQPASPPASPAPEPPAVAVNSSQPESQNPPVSRLRLKPKLTIDEPVAQAVSPAPATPEPPAEPPPIPVISLRPSSAATVAPAIVPSPAPVDLPDTPAPAAEVPSPAKLKINLQRDPAAASPPALPAAPPVEASPKPPPFPVIAPAAATPPRFPPPVPQSKPDAKPAIPHLRAPQRLVEEMAAPKAKAAKKESAQPRGSRRFLAAAAGVVLVVAGLAGFRYYRHTLNPKLVAPTPAPASTAAAKPAPATAQPAVAATAKTPEPKPVATPPKAAATTPKPAPARNENPTPSETLNTLAHTPARAIAKAQAVVDAQNARAHDQMEAFGDPAPARQPAATAPAPKPVATFTASSRVAAGVTATAAVGSTSGSASAEFREWVGSARLSGLFQGSNPRALINGRMVHPGDIVDDTLTITFAGIAPDGKTLVFRDPTGATVSRKF